MSYRILFICLIGICFEDAARSFGGLQRISGAMAGLWAVLIEGNHPASSAQEEIQSVWSFICARNGIKTAWEDGTLLNGFNRLFIAASRHRGKGATFTLE